MVRIMSKKFLLLVCFMGFCAFSRGQVAKLFCNQKGVTCPVLFPPNCLRVDNILANYDTLYYKKDTLFFWPILVFVMFGILETWDKFTI